QLPDLFAGRPTPGPLLWSIRQAPAGFGELWHAPGAPATSIAVVPPQAGRPMQIAVLDVTHHLKGYSSDGTPGKDIVLDDEKIGQVRAVDLDGDGSNEWIGVKDTGFEVMDAEGRSYWKYDSHVTPESFDFLGFADLNGDGSQEILVRGGDAVSALRDV